LLSNYSKITENAVKRKKEPMDNVGLVLIGHGSKLPHNQENLEKLAEIMREKSSFKVVEISFMVRNSPTIPEAIDAVASRGVTKIVLVPAFLSAGVHTTQEIPELIGIKEKELQLSAKGIEVFYGEPIGADECLAVILEEKALYALGKKVTAHLHAQFAANTNNVNSTAVRFAVPDSSAKIFDTSMSLIRPEIKDLLEKAPKSHVPIIERVVHTTADPEFANLLSISDGAVDAGLAAIRAGAKIITDVKMIKAGINEARVKRFGGSLFSYIDDARAVKMANVEQITRSAAAVRLAVEDGVDGAIFLIGNAPTAAFELAKAVEAGKAKPALIVATAVGYVGAAESKEAVANLSVPTIVIRGRKGGSPISVAIFNALLKMAEEAN
jgi:precorrin-8X/cobalt-precorrin-8 methylmutase